MKLKLQWPIILVPTWKDKMIKYAKEGRSLAAVKEIKYGLNIGLKDAKLLWDTKYKPKYYKPTDSFNYD